MEPLNDYIVHYYDGDNYKLISGKWTEEEFEKHTEQLESEGHTVQLAIKAPAGTLLNDNVWVANEIEDQCTVFQRASMLVEL